MDIHLNLAKILLGACAIFLAGLSGGLWNPFLQPLIKKIVDKFKFPDHLTIEKFEEFKKENTDQHAGVIRMLGENTLELGQVSRGFNQLTGRVDSIKESVDFLKEMEIARQSRIQVNSDKRASGQ